MNIYNNRVRNTVIKSAQAEKKQISVDKQAYEVVAQMANKSNKKYSQGVIVYEYLMLTHPEYTDEITEYENMVNEKLKNHDIDPDVINEIEWSDGVDFDSDDDKKQVRFWLPPNIKYQTDNRQWTDTINNSIKQGLNTIFFDRLDRIEAKKQISEHLANNTDPDNKRAKKIIEDSDDIDIPDSLEIDTAIKDDIETVSDYQDYADDVCDDWDDRFQVLDQIVKNNRPSRGRIRSVLIQTHGIDTRDYVDKKIDKFTNKFVYPYLFDTTEVDISKNKKHIKENIVEYIDAKYYSLTQIMYNIERIDEDELAEVIDSCDALSEEYVRIMLKDDDYPIMESPMPRKSLILYKN